VRAVVSQCRSEVTVTDGRFFSTVRVAPLPRWFGLWPDPSTWHLDPFDALAIGQREVERMRAAKAVQP
jgi:hypothetical protein